MKGTLPETSAQSLPERMCPSDRARRHPDSRSPHPARRPHHSPEPERHHADHEPDGHPPEHPPHLPLLALEDRAARVPLAVLLSESPARRAVAVRVGGGVFGGHRVDVGAGLMRWLVCDGVREGSMFCTVRRGRCAGGESARRVEGKRGGGEEWRVPRRGELLRVAEQVTGNAFAGRRHAGKLMFQQLKKIVFFHKDQRAPTGECYVSVIFTLCVINITSVFERTQRLFCGLQRN